MKNMKKLMLLAFVLLFALAFVACGDDSGDDKNATNAPTQGTGNNATAAPTEDEGPVRDLNGLDVVIADWWSDEGYDTPNSTYEEKYWAYQKQMMQKHNYTIRRAMVSSWSDMTQDALLSITTNRPLGSIIVLDSGFVASLLSNDVFLDVSKIEEFDFHEDKWNQTVLEVMTVGDAIYGFAASTEPRTGVFFNMDLFAQLGLDRELPYNLQAEGAWTFDEFTSLCSRLTQDTDNDGVTDVYAIASFSADFFQACLLANNTDVIVKNADGTLKMNADDPSVVEALEWGRSLYDLGYHMPQPEDSEWNWFVDAFKEQKAAMRVCEEYNASEIVKYDFTAGFVCFPKGPNADSLLSITRENILIIPSCDATKSVANDIAFAYNIFTNDVPEWEGEKGLWKQSYTAMFKDSRAVNETLQKMIEDLDQIMSCTILLSDYAKDWIYDIDAGAATPAEQIEAMRSSWSSMVEDFNATYAK